MRDRRQGLADAVEQSGDPSRDEREIWASLANGDKRAAVSGLMDLYGTLVHRYCRGMVGDDATADDLLQTVFLQAHQDLHKVRQGSTLRIWLFAIARHRSIDLLRRRRRWFQVLTQSSSWTEAFEPADERPSPEEGLQARDGRASLEDCLQRLAPDARANVLLRFRDEMAYEDMAAMAGTSPGALRVRIARAVSALRACLERKALR